MNRNILIRIATDPPARLWSGSGDLYLPIDAIETEDGARYLGGGELLDGLTDIPQLLNGTAARLELSVSGVALATTRLATEEAENVKGAAVDIGVVRFDDLWQPIGVTWQARYRADKLTVTRGDTTRTITLSMGSDDTGRSNARQGYWTPADQARRSPDDRIFDRVPSLNAGTSRPFGPRG